MPPLPEAQQPEEAPLESKAYQRAQEFLTQRLAPIKVRTDELVDEAPPPQQPPVGAEGPGVSPAASRLGRLQEYRQRQAALPTPKAGGPPDVTDEAAQPAPHVNWMSIGPVVVRKGQGATRPAVSGRAVGLAIANAATTMYLASANGGVWRSQDRGQTWQSKMDAWDLNPTTAQSDSLACGAIAIDPNDAERVFVGTGEGAGGAYFGVGPIRSDDGGTNWTTEPVAAGSPPLAGAAFYQLAVDPLDTNHVLGATTLGLYRRRLAAAGPEWHRVLSGTFTSVCAAGAGAGRRFFAAAWSGQPMRSADGQTWTAAGTGFPAVDVGRIGLAATHTADGAVVYALVAHRTTYHLLGVWRLDPDGRWRPVANMPANLFGSGARGQGWYDLAIAVDPTNVNRIYVGGSTVSSSGQWSGSLFRCDVSPAGAGSALTYSAVPAYIGAGCHADVHALVFEPGDPDRLWVCCDGGVFSTDAARTAADLTPRNVGLATLTMNHLGTHPSEEAVLFCGTQDNGTTRYTGEHIWLHSGPGDGGYAVINCADPYRILRTYTYGIIYRAIDGGQGYASWAPVSIPAPHTNQSLFYAPLSSAPFDDAHPATADVVAFGGRRVWLSTSFGSVWTSLPRNDATDDLTGLVRSLAFASSDRLYAGTMNGEVHRFDRGPGGWTRTPIHAAPLLVGPVTEIAVDPADATGSSIYVTLGGQGSFEHVWHFDGHAWSARSGPGAGAPDSLLDVHCDAIVVDPAHHDHLYVGADIGIWRSVDAGQTWAVWSQGLPDAAVLDLKIHHRHRVIWAATHGRGVFERLLDADTAAGTELFIRDTPLDAGRRVSVGGLPDPTAHGVTVALSNSPDIKVDPPDAGGSYQANDPSFFDFVDRLEDRSTSVPSSGSLSTRVHVLVHNRGVDAAPSVRVTLLMARHTGAIPALPAGYDAAIRAGQNIASPQWTRVGTRTISNLRHGLSRAATFKLSRARLGTTAGTRYRLLAILHAAVDPFTSTQVDADALAAHDRKVAQKEIQLV